MLNSTYIEKINQLILKYGQHGGFSENSDITLTSLPTAKALIELYESYGPQENTCIEIGSSVLFFISKHKLNNSQIGYRTYENGSPIEKWDQQLVVIGLYNDEPIIVNTDDERSEILAAYESGQPKVVSSSLEEFFYAIYLVIQIQYESFNFEILDDETFEYKDDFVETVDNRLDDCLSDEHKQNFMDFFFG